MNLLELHERVLKYKDTNKDEYKSGKIDKYTAIDWNNKFDDDLEIICELTNSINDFMHFAYNTAKCKEFIKYQINKSELDYNYKAELDVSSIHEYYYDKFNSLYN